jgi:hypothetical protein
MTDSNTYNFQDYNQNQVIDFGTNQIQTGNEIDPSTYLQGDSAILQASAGLGETTTENVDYLNQNNFDTNAIFGETIKKINETPYGQNFQGTTTTTTGNIIDGNTLFSDNNGLITNTTTTQEVQGTTIDTNTFFNNTNIDTNAIYGQTQILPTTTTENTYYSQPQEIQGTTTYGETQILPSTDSNTYFDTAQITYDQPQTQTQNDYTTYQTSDTVDLNNYNFGTTNIETTNTYTTEAIPVTQNETTTTTTTTNTYVEPTYETTQNYGITNTQTYQTSEIPVTTTTQNIFDTSEIPMTETKYLSPKPQYEVSQFQQTYDTTPVTTTTTTTNVTTENIRTTNVVNQPIVQTNYVPTSNQIITQPQVQNTRITTTTNQTIPENINNNQVTRVTRVTNPPPQKNESKPQIIPINLNKNKGPSAYKILGNLIDEDFKRGRPIYTEYGSPYVKLRHYDQVSPTYQVRRVMNDNRNVIGLSRLTPALSYDRVGNNPPTLTSTLMKSNTNQIYPYNSNINNIRQDMNLINSNLGLDRITKATSYDAGTKQIDPLLNNYGFNQNKF